MIRRPPRSTRTDTLFSLHDALPIYLHPVGVGAPLLAARLHRPGELDRAAEQQQLLGERGLPGVGVGDDRKGAPPGDRSEEHTSELQSLMRISYAVFCLKKKKPTQN